MSRLARQISQTGLYHIVFRGVNKQDIFEETSDYKTMIDILNHLKIEMQFEIYAYCLMSNHVHILLKEKKMGDISLIMKRLLTKYARFYNAKYQRSGALIANRYKSQSVEADEYFLCVVRYIHQNPVKAKIIEDINGYKWSSYNEYIDENKIITDVEFVFEMMDKAEFIEFHKIEETEIFEVNDKVKPSDEAIRRKIMKIIGIEPKQIGSLEKTKRNEILNTLKNEYSIRQLERVTGVSRGIISKC